MEGNQEPQYDIRSVLLMGGRALEDVTLPVTNAGRLEFGRRLEDLDSALATVRTRLEVALVLSRVPTSPTEVGTSPMAAEAVDRLLLALINVLAFRDT